jgi:DNA-binding response OmpR family regulator
MRWARGTSRASGAADAVNDLGTVMIVEDEAIIAMSLEEGLSDEGVQVLGPFSACAEALAFLEAEIPQCAILEAQLSDGTCLELARELQRREVPFLIYSGIGGFEARAPELRCVTWIEKPPLSTW